MYVNNRHSKTAEQVEALTQDTSPGPVCMVNLIKFKDKAEYADGRETNLSGAEAYQLYGGPVGDMVAAGGGRIVFSSVVTGMVVGEVEELWDAIAIAEYPSRRAFLEMVDSPEWAEISVHRDAGLAGQLNIATTQVGGV